MKDNYVKQLTHLQLIEMINKLKKLVLGVIKFVILYFTIITHLHQSIIYFISFCLFFYY